MIRDLRLEQKSFWKILPWLVKSSIDTNQRAKSLTNLRTNLIIKVKSPRESGYSGVLLISFRVVVMFKKAGEEQYGWEIPNFMVLSLRIAKVK